LRKFKTHTVLNWRLLLSIFMFLPIFISATHNRGGEITYKRLGGFTYEFTITTCTDVGPQSQADRNELIIDFGDGIIDTFPRTQIVPQPLNHQKNIYVGIHTFQSMGSYKITVEDPNRNGGILNIYPNSSTNSNSVVFAIECELFISPFTGGGNTSVQFDECPCPAIACVGFPYCYNPQAVDPDGDSLSYELVAPLGANAVPLSVPIVYNFPHLVGGGTASLDQVTGTYCWTNPGMIGEFNFAIKITEWRNGIRVGSVTRDIQLTVQGSCSNIPPAITAPPQICVTAGDNVSFTVNVNDPDNNSVSLVGSGLPLDVTSNPASFPSVSGIGTVNGIFNWNTNCSHIKPGVYNVLFAVTDNGSPTMQNYAQTQIKVIAPKVIGVLATPFGNGVNVSWNATTCSNAEGYHIYRTTNPGFTMPTCCDNPNPLNQGFVKVGTVIGANTTTFYDASSLSLGIDYCYVITAFYLTNQVESCPSEASCASLKKEVPILTHVTVNTTDNTIGIDSIMWSKPTELDTIQYPGPYHYKIYKGISINTINTLIGQTAPTTFLYQSDTTFTAVNLNTVGQVNYFRVEMYYSNNGNDSLVGTSNSAGSVFAFTTANDSEITIQWVEQVPWMNYEYEVYRSLNFSGPFSLIGTTTNQIYSDDSLINGANYCYYVKSFGEYSSPSIINPIENLSQIVCDIPIDKTAPCSPVLTIDGDCGIGQNVITWTNPNNDCADDVVRYYIYFSPIEGEEMSLIATIDNANDTSFTHNFNGSVAGCYAVTAVDSLQYANESVLSNIVCFDNCPAYWLPNVFSPNGDGNNDTFKPIAPYAYVESVEFEVYNRWGQIVFKTTDPDIGWNGLHMETNTPVPNGVYYYLCTVNTIRLIGIEPIIIKGFIHIYDNTGDGGN
jgi:gliding motility-associated-like protein